MLFYLIKVKATFTCFLLFQICAPRWQNNIETLENQSPLSHMNGICYEIPRVLDTFTIGKYPFLSKDKDQRTLNESHYYYHYMHGMMGMSAQYTGDVSCYDVFINVRTIYGKCKLLSDFDLIFRVHWSSFCFSLFHRYYKYHISCIWSRNDCMVYISGRFHLTITFFH